MLIDAVQMAAGPNVRADQVPIQNMHSRSLPLLVMETPQREICYLDSKAITTTWNHVQAHACNRPD